MDAPRADPRTTMSVEALYRSHAAEIFRYAYAMLGNRADAEDVTQTTFINAMRAIEQHGEPRKPSNWLITIAHNVVRQRFRQQQARPAEVELETELEAKQVDDGGPSIGDLVRALQGIPPNQREALVMRELEGRPYREIAAMLDLSLSAVETLIFRARRSLAEELQQLVTCDRAELAISQREDGRLSRKDRRRLDTHLRDCPACAELEARQTTFQTAFRRLALVPAPLTMSVLDGGSGATLATGASSIGAGAAVAGGGSTVAAGSSIALAGGATAKLAVVAAALATAGGVGYHVERSHASPPQHHPAANHRAAVTHGRTGVTRPARGTAAPKRVEAPGAPAPKATVTVVATQPAGQAATPAPAPTSGGDAGTAAASHGHATADSTPQQGSERSQAVQQAHADQTAQAHAHGNGNGNGNGSANGNAKSTGAGSTNGNSNAPSTPPGQAKKAQASNATSTPTANATATTPPASSKATPAKGTPGMPAKGSSATPPKSNAATPGAKADPKPKQAAAPATAAPDPSATTTTTDATQTTPTQTTSTPAADPAHGGGVARGDPGRPGSPRAH